MNGHSMLACLLTIQFAIDSARPKNIISFSTSRPAPEVIGPEFVAPRKSRNLEFDSSGGDENGFPTGTSRLLPKFQTRHPPRSSEKAQTLI